MVNYVLHHNNVGLYSMREFGGNVLMLKSLKTKSRKTIIKTVAVLGLLNGILSLSVPASAEPVSSPPELGTVGAFEPISEGSTVYTEGDGVIRLTFNNAPYKFDGFVLTSWDKLDGTWSSPEEMVKAYKDSMACFASNAVGDPAIDYKPIADKCSKQYGLPVYEELSSTPMGKTGATVEYTPSKSGVQNFFAVSMWRVDSTTTGLGYDYTASEPLFFSLDVKLGTKPYSSNTVTPEPKISADFTNTPVGSSTVEETAGFFSKTVFSALRTLGVPSAEMGLAAVTAGLVVVLSLLVGFPTQLLNSTIDANRNRFKTPRWLANIAIVSNRTLARISSTKSGSKKFQTIKAYLIIIVSSIIAGFVQPDFGLNLMSLRLVLTVLAAFLIINIGSSYAMWLVGKKYGETEKPSLKARPAYIVFVLVTVLFSRAIEAEPAIVFGALLAVELTTRVAEQKKLRTEMFALGYVITVGLLGWILFMATFRNSSSLSTLVSEFGSVVTVEALSTLPILLLPMKFMFGESIWKTYGWKKWLLIYSGGLFLFSFVLLPMPFSWDVIDVPFISWVSVLFAYAAFALITWKYFQVKVKKISNQ